MSYRTLKVHPDAEASRYVESTLRLRDLAASVILQALADLRCNDFRARASAFAFIRDDGGGMWADLLGIDRDAVRRAAPIIGTGGRPTHKRRRLNALLEAAA